MKNLHRWFSIIFCTIFFSILLVSCNQVPKTVIVTAADSQNPSWSSTDIKFAQDFRMVLENGEKIDAPKEESEIDSYAVVIETPLGHWEYQLYIILDGTDQAIAQDSEGVTRQISDYNTGVIRQIFSDVTEKGVTVLT